MCDYQRVKARQSRRHDAPLGRWVKRKSVTDSAGQSCFGFGEYFMQKRIGYRRPRRRLDTWAIALFLCLGTPAPGGQDSGLRDDPDYREELGVNHFTTPSIEELFEILDSLKPIPFQQLREPVTELNTDDRTRYALAFGVLIGDGFLDVETEDSKDVEALGRELIRRGTGLGVGSRITRHSQRLFDLAKKGHWQDLRKELVVTQDDVEQAMLDLRDEEMANLLSLGGWIRGLEIGAAGVASSYSKERAERLRHLDLLDYYLDRLSTLNPRLKKRPLIQNLTAGLKDIRDLLAHAAPISAADDQKLRDEAHALVILIETDTGGEASSTGIK